MAITVRNFADGQEPRTPQRIGTMLMAMREIVLDNSYPTGGETVTPADLGLKTVWFAICEEVAPGTTKYHYAYDITAQKLQVYTSNGAAPAALAELDSTSATQNGKVIRIIAFGK